MPMEPNRTRQVIQDLARAFNKLASELTADLSYAAREIEGLRKEVQRLRSTSGKPGHNVGSSKKPSSGSSKRSGASRKVAASHKSRALSPESGPDSPKPAHEPGSFVFPQEPFSPTPPAQPTPSGNN